MCRVNYLLTISVLWSLSPETLAQNDTITKVINATNHVEDTRIDLEPEPGNTYGVHLEPFKQTGTYALKSGPVVVVDNRTFFLPNFHYDGKCPGAHFRVGKGTEPSITDDGFVIPDEKGSTETLAPYTGQNIYLTLPSSITINDIDYLSIWSVIYQQNIGHVIIPGDLKTPETNRKFNRADDNRTVIWVQKCCPIDYNLFQSGCKKSPQEFNLVIDVHAHNLSHLDDEPLDPNTIKFEPYVHQVTCPYDKFPLHPKFDEFSLLENGSLMVKSLQKLLPLDEYCMETVKFEDEQETEWITTAIICFTSSEQPTSSTMFTIYAIGALISALFLSVTAVVFLLVKEVRDTRGKCVVGYSCFMAAAFICLAVAQLHGVDENDCVVLGFVLQFCLVSSFTWLSTISWETFFKIRKYNSDEYNMDKKRLKIYIGIGIGMPCIILIVSLIFDRIPDIPNTFLKPEFGRNSCWFDEKQTTILYFYVPFVVSIAFNIVLAVLMKLKINTLQKNGRDGSDISWNSTKQDLKPMYRSCAFLSSLMAFCWITEIVSFVFKSDSGVWMAMDIITSLQGLLVFLIFVFHRPVKDKLLKHLQKLKCSTKTGQPEEEPMTMNGLNHKEFLQNLSRTESIEHVS